MKIITILTCAAVWLSPSLYAEESKYPPINPALLYWQAAALLPKLNDEQAAEIRGIALGKQPADPAKIESLGFGGAERLIRKAAESSAPCDWGLAREDGPEMQAPHISKIREMASIALAIGEARLAEGKTPEGLAWFLTAHRIARHSGASEFLVSYLVQESIETDTLRAAARHCLGWDEATRHGYAKKMNELPPLHGLQEAYRGELLFADWFESLGELSKPERSKIFKSLLAMSGDSGESALDKKGMEKHRYLMEPENLREEVAAYRDIHRQVLDAFGKPWKEAEIKIATISENIERSDSILLKILFPTTLRFKEKEAERATLRRMLDVALQHGAQIDEAAAAAVHDSFEGQSLRLKNADGSLSLVAGEQRPKAKIIELKLGK